MAYSVSRGQLAWRALWRRFERIGWGGSRTCVCCGRNIFRFLPFAGGWATAPQVVRQLQIIGSDLRYYECPRCGASDRERHLHLYCSRLELDRKMAGARILHFAPEPHFSRFVRSAGPAEYIQADLFPRDPGVKQVDMLAIPYADQSFDWVIANHVLEHVADDRAALGEICRVLKPGGLAILQTPFSAVLEHAWEDKGVDTDESREFAYGQSDHVRLYGRDIVDRLASAGFLSRVCSHEGVLTDVDVRRHGVNGREPFFLFERRG